MQYRGGPRFPPSVVSFVISISRARLAWGAQLTKVPFRRGCCAVTTRSSTTSRSSPSPFFRIFGSTRAFCRCDTRSLLIRPLPLLRTRLSGLVEKVHLDVENGSLSPALRSKGRRKSTATSSIRLHRQRKVLRAVHTPDRRALDLHRFPASRQMVPLARAVPAQGEPPTCMRHNNVAHITHGCPFYVVVESVGGRICRFGFRHRPGGRAAPSPPAGRRDEPTP